MAIPILHVFLKSFDLNHFCLQKKPQSKRDSDVNPVVPILGPSDGVLVLGGVKSEVARTNDATIFMGSHGAETWVLWIRWRDVHTA